MADRVFHLLSQRPGWTGSGVALDAMVRAANRRGWEQSVVIGTPHGEPTAQVGGLAPASIRPLVFGQEPLAFPLPGMSDVMPYPSSRFSELTAPQLDAYRQAWRDQIAAAVTAFRPHVIHSHHVWLMSSVVKDVAASVPVVTHCHGTGLRQMELCPHLAEEVVSGCARNEAFAVLHRGHATALQTRLGLDSDRIHVVGSGFRDELFHDRGRPETVGSVVTYVGKLSRAKGLPWLIEAVEQIGRRRPEVILNVAGSGSGAEAEAIRQQMHECEHVAYHGQLDQEALAALLRRSTVFALPSFFEGLPLVLVEAVACGCRLVATELPGVAEELQPRLGEALEMVAMPRLESIDRPVAADLPAFVDRLAGAIESALAKPPLKGASRFVEGRTWEAVFETIEAVWLSLV